MAGSVKSLSAPWILALLLPLCTSPAAGEALPDPTRPPEAMLAGAPGEMHGSGLVLQSVLMGKGRKPAAIISGQVVRLGGKIGDARLIRLTESRVVLASPEGETTLQLTPAVEKHTVPGVNTGNGPQLATNGGRIPDTKEDAGKK